MLVFTPTAIKSRQKIGANNAEDIVNVIAKHAGKEA